MLDADITELNQQFESVIEALALSLQSTATDESRKMLQIIQALRQNLQIMLRHDSDVKNNKKPELSEKEITEIADYALNLLDEVAAGCAARGMQDQMLQLHRMSLPIVSWLHRYGGKLVKLDIVVNAIASFANTLQNNKDLEILCQLVNKVVEVTDPLIKQDLEASNPMRPWRILNLNWGIVATRTHNTDMMEHVFDHLLENIPADAKQFFNEGMQQMDIIGYPEPVRIVMKKYVNRMADDGVLH